MEKGRLYKFDKDVYKILSIKEETFTLVYVESVDEDLIGYESEWSLEHLEEDIDVTEIYDSPLYRALQGE